MPSFYTIFAFAFGFGAPYNKDSFKKALESYTTFIKNAEEQLKHGKKFLLGDHVSLIDIIVGCMFVWPLNVSLDKDYRDNHKSFFTYLELFYAQDEVKSIIGDVKYIDKFDPSKYEKKE